MRKSWASLSRIKDYMMYKYSYIIEGGGQTRTKS